MPKFLTIPVADGDSLTNARIHDGETLFGLTNGTSYLCYRLSEPSHDFTPAAGETTLDPNPIWAEGDSYMGYGGVNLHQKIAAETGLNVVRTAVSGSTMDEILARVQSGAAANAARTLVIWDGSHNGMTMVSEYVDLLQTVVGLLPHDRFILIPPAVWSVNEKVVAEAVRDEMLARWPSRVIDWRSWITHVDGVIPASQMIDSIHLGHAAMDQMALGVKAFLEQPNPWPALPPLDPVAPVDPSTPGLELVPDGAFQGAGPTLHLANGGLAAITQPGVLRITNTVFAGWGQAQVQVRTTVGVTYRVRMHKTTANGALRVRGGVGTGAWAHTTNATALDIEYTATHPITALGFSTGSDTVGTFAEITLISLQAVQQTVQTVPAAFTAPDWSLATGSAPNAIDINVTTAPADGGSPLTALEYRVNGAGSWIALSGTGTGSRTVSMPEAGAAYAIQLRAVNAIGAGAAGDSKNATSGAAAAPVSWTPAEAANVVAWWDYEGVGAGAVASVEDKSGNGHTLTPINASAAPVMTHGGGKRWLQHPGTATPGGMQAPASIPTKYILIYAQWGTGVEATPDSAGVTGDARRAVLHKGAGSSSWRLALVEGSSLVGGDTTWNVSRSGGAWSNAMLPLPYQAVESVVSTRAAFAVRQFGGTDASGNAGRIWRFPYLPLAVFSEAPDEETRAKLRAWADHVVSAG